MEKRQQSPALTYSDVKGVCDRLHASGEKISGNRVIAELGRGSKGTALGFVRQWREELEASQAHLMESMGFSDAFADSFMKEMGRFQTAIESRFEETLRAAKSSEAEALSALADAESKIERLQFEVQKKEQLAQEHSEQHAAAKSSWTTTEQTLRDQLEEKSRVIAEHRTQIDRLTTDLAKAEMRLEDSSKLVEEAQSNREQLRSELKDIREKLTQAETQNATISAQNEALRESLKAEKESHQTTQDRVNHLQERLMQSEKGLGRLETISEALDTEKAAHAATSKPKSKLESDLNSERKAHISTKKKLSQLEVKD